MKATSSSIDQALRQANLPVATVTIPPLRLSSDSTNNFDISEGAIVDDVQRHVMPCPFRRRLNQLRTKWKRRGKRARRSYA